MDDDTSAYLWFARSRAARREALRRRADAEACRMRAAMLQRVLDRAGEAGLAAYVLQRLDDAIRKWSSVADENAANAALADSIALRIEAHLRAAPELTSNPVLRQYFGRRLPAEDRYALTPDEQQELVRLMRDWDNRNRGRE